MNAPELWTELEYAAARRRQRELVRQRRWKEARSLLRAMSRAVTAELARAACGRCQAENYRTFTKRSRYSRNRNFEKLTNAGTGVAPLSA